MARNIYRNVAYGLSDSLVDVFQVPIASNRDPLGSDKYQFGTLWVNKSTNDAFVLTSVVNNVANWVGIGGGSGDFTSLTVNPGNLTVTAGNLIVTAGTITAGSGLTVTTGGILVSAGNISLTSGSITLSLGNLDVTAGSVLVTAGRVAAVEVQATGDLSAGTAGATSLTNVTNTTQSSGALSILSTTTNNGNNAGFLKVYVGTTIAYVPYFTDIAP